VNARAAPIEAARRAPGAAAFARGTVRELPCRGMGLGKAVVAGISAKMLTGSLLGFVVVFALIYWLL
jgi:hypothetical protein